MPTTLVGHLDEVSANHVAGWAADSADPDGTVTVSISVDGWKVGSAEANRFRPDLKNRDVGEGRHGFRWEFPTKLDLSSDKKISVWFAQSGSPLGAGEVLLSGGGAVSQPRANDDLPPLPPPLNQRELFELLSLYEPEEGLYGFLRHFDLCKWSAKHARYAALGQLGTTLNKSSTAVADYFTELLLSSEFQSSLIPSLLTAYPEKRRLLFVHIPKCAGTDLREILRRHYPSLDYQVMDPEWYGKPQLFSELRSFVRIVRFYDSIFLRNHIPLNYYIKHELARPSDMLFTIVRDPTQMALSQVNYVMTRIRDDHSRRQFDRDTRAWLKILELEELPAEISAEFGEQVCKRALYDKRIVVPNSMCHWLGGGDAEVVLRRLCDQNAEVTDTARYAHWLKERWGLESSSRRNASVAFVSDSSLSAVDREHLSEINQEDTKLYSVLQDKLRESRRPWILGSELST